MFKNMYLFIYLRDRVIGRQRENIFFLLAHFPDSNKPTVSRQELGARPKLGARASCGTPTQGAGAQALGIAFPRPLAWSRIQSGAARTQTVAYMGCL